MFVFFRSKCCSNSVFSCFELFEKMALKKKRIESIQSSLPFFRHRFLSLSIVYLSIFLRKLQSEDELARPEITIGKLFRRREEKEREKGTILENAFFERQRSSCFRTERENEKKGFYGRGRCERAIDR